VPQPTPEQPEADEGEISENEGPNHGAIDGRQKISAADAAGDTGHDEAPEQLPIDIAMENMADGGDCGGAGFGGMNAGGGCARGNAQRKQQAAQYDAIGHAEGTVDDLGAEADQYERQQQQRKIQPSVGQGNPFL